MKPADILNGNWRKLLSADMPVDLKVWLEALACQYKKLFKIEARKDVVMLAPANADMEKIYATFVKARISYPGAFRRGNAKLLGLKWCLK